MTPVSGLKIAFTGFPFVLCHCSYLCLLARRPVRPVNHHGKEPAQHFEGPGIATCFGLEATARKAVSNYRSVIAPLHESRRNALQCAA